MNQGLTKKPLFWTNLIVLVLFGFAVADVIFGWTNPSGPPPNPPGAVRAVSDEVGIGTDPVTGNRLSVSGLLNMVSNRIVNVAEPTLATDAATKNYVDSAGGGSDGGGETVTLFGVAQNATVVGTSLSWAPNGAVPPGCRANPSACAAIVASWGARNFTYVYRPAAGEGAPTCSSITVSPIDAKGNWREIFAGYGPHETVVQNFVYSTTLQSPEDDPNNWKRGEDPDNLGFPGFFEDSLPTSGTGIADSVCSNSVFQNVYVSNTALGAPVGREITPASGYNSACSTIGCNTCRICQWDPL